MNQKQTANRVALHVTKAFLKSELAELTQDQIDDFLESQVDCVKITVILPDDSDDQTDRTASQKYPQPDKEKQNQLIEEQLFQEEKEVDEITSEWELLKASIDTLPEGNGGKPFYRETLLINFLKNRRFIVELKKRKHHSSDTIDNNDPYDEINKNNPFLYQGIDTLKDYRDFLIQKFSGHQMHFKECFLHPYDFDMPLDVYNTTAIIKNSSIELPIYVKFGIQKNQLTAELEFENISFHPPKK